MLRLTRHASTENFAVTHRNFLGGQTRFMSPEVRSRRMAESRGKPHLLTVPCSAESCNWHPMLS